MPDPYLLRCPRYLSSFGAHSDRNLELCTKHNALDTESGFTPVSLEPPRHVMLPEPWLPVPPWLSSVRAKPAIGLFFFILSAFSRLYSKTGTGKAMSDPHTEIPIPAATVGLVPQTSSATGLPTLLPCVRHHCSNDGARDKALRKYLNGLGW